MKRKRFVLLLLLVVLIALGTAYWRLTAPPPSQREAAHRDFPAVEIGDTDTPEAKARRPLLGVWKDEYKGKRTMTLNEDGTGTMVVELSGAQAFLFASKLHFDMKWSL